MAPDPPTSAVNRNILSGVLVCAIRKHRALFRASTSCHRVNKEGGVDVKNAAYNGRTDR